MKTKMRAFLKRFHVYNDIDFFLFFVVSSVALLAIVSTLIKAPMVVLISLLLMAVLYYIYKFILWLGRILFGLPKYGECYLDD